MKVRIFYSIQTTPVRKVHLFPGVAYCSCGVLYFVLFAFAFRSKFNVTDEGQDGFRTCVRPRIAEQTEKDDNHCAIMHCEDDWQLSADDHRRLEPGHK